MQIVDSHCHVSPVWYEPVETLLNQMDRNGVAQAVVVQILGQYSNGYQQDCLERYPGRFASVVGVDVADPDALQKLTRLASEGAAGVRLRPLARSPGSDPYAIWRAAEAAELVVSCVGSSDAFAAPEFFDLVRQFDGLRIVLEHLGGTSQADASEAARDKRRAVFDLAELPNVYMKLPGLGELVPRAAELPDEGAHLDGRDSLVGLAIERFGPERLMWGSDFPPVAAREGYTNALGWVRQALADLPTEAQAQIFGGTAQRVFKLPAS